MTTPKIAVIGLEASGKTVLMSVLAKKLSQTIHQGYFLDPKGVKTIKYIESVWETLQHSDWPPSTPPGEMFNLRWGMRITPDFSKDGKTYEAELHLLDAAGQDMRQLFAFDSLEDSPEYLRPLAEYCKQADILLIALNIIDFLGQSVPQMRRIENQATIKAALDMLHKSNQHAAILFTQMDQYKPYIDKAGGLESFCKTYLPYIYNSYIANSSTSLISVAAVNDTMAVKKENGKLVRVPKPNFSSFGLEDVCKWLAGQVVEFSKRDAEEIAAANKKREQIYAIQSQTSPHSAMKRCPYCGETILADAIKCRYCRNLLTPQANYIYTSVPPQKGAAIPVPQAMYQNKPTSYVLHIILGVIALCIIIFGGILAVLTLSNHHASSYRPNDVAGRPGAISKPNDNAPSSNPVVTPVTGVVHKPTSSQAPNVTSEYAPKTEPKPVFIPQPKPDPMPELSPVRWETGCDHSGGANGSLHNTRIIVDAYNPGSSGNYIITATITVNDVQHTRRLPVYLSHGRKSQVALDFFNVCSKYEPGEVFMKGMEEGAKMKGKPEEQILGGVVLGLIGGTIVDNINVLKDVKLVNLDIQRAAD